MSQRRTGFFARMRALTRLGTIAALAFVLAPLQVFVAKPIFNDTTTIPSFMAKLTGGILGLKTTFNGVAIDKKDSTLYIANHMSYLDPLILGMRVPGVFISKFDVSEIPVIGRLCKSIGTIFIHRTKKALPEVHRAMSEALNQKKSIVFFPEAGTTSGEDVRPFHAGALSVVFNNLSEVELEADVQVQPLSIRLTHVNGVDIEESPELRDAFAWYTDISMEKHFWALAHEKSVGLEIKAFPIMKPSEYSGRKAFTQAAWETVRSGVVVQENTNAESAIEASAHTPS